MAGSTSPPTAASTPSCREPNAGEGWQRIKNLLMVKMACCSPSTSCQAAGAALKPSSVNSRGCAAASLCCDRNPRRRSRGVNFPSICARSRSTAADAGAAVGATAVRKQSRHLRTRNKETGREAGVSGYVGEIGPGSSVGYLVDFLAAAASSSRTLTIASFIATLMQSASFGVASLYFLPSSSQAAVAASRTRFSSSAAPA